MTAGVIACAPRMGSAHLRLAQFLERSFDYHEFANPPRSNRRNDCKEHNAGCQEVRSRNRTEHQAAMLHLLAISNGGHGADG